MPCRRDGPCVAERARHVGSPRRIERRGVGEDAIDAELRIVSQATRIEDEFDDRIASNDFGQTGSVDAEPAVGNAKGTRALDP